MSSFGKMVSAKFSFFLTLRNLWARGCSLAVKHNRGQVRYCQLKPALTGSVRTGISAWNTTTRSGSVNALQLKRPESKRWIVRTVTILTPPSSGEEPNWDTQCFGVVSTKINVWVSNVVEITETARAKVSDGCRDRILCPWLNIHPTSVLQLLRLLRSGHF